MDWCSKHSKPTKDIKYCPNKPCSMNCKHYDWDDPSDTIKYSDVNHIAKAVKQLMEDAK